MDNALGESFALVLALLFVAIAVYVLTSMRKRSFIESFPVGEKRNRLLAEVSQMRRENKSRAERLKHLRHQGLSKNVSQALVDEAERRFSNPQHGERKPGLHEAHLATPTRNHVAGKSAPQLQVN